MACAMSWASASAAPHRSASPDSRERRRCTPSSAAMRRPRLWSISARRRRCSRAAEASRARTRPCQRAARQAPPRARQSARRSRWWTSAWRIRPPWRRRWRRSVRALASAPASAVPHTTPARAAPRQRSRAARQPPLVRAARARRRLRAAAEPCVLIALSAAEAQRQAWSRERAVRCVHSRLRRSSKRSQSRRCCARAHREAVKDAASPPVPRLEAREYHERKPVTPSVRQSSAPKRRSVRCCSRAASMARKAVRLSRESTREPSPRKRRRCDASARQNRRHACSASVRRPWRRRRPVPPRQAFCNNARPRRKAWSWS
mmetsp:Transcript_108966/g.243182  ORF Transcript_108966/g.243182 Transcript_108966/m.243182 type:complete len:318 (-) Transcript_108966:67-1020(-)